MTAPVLQGIAPSQVVSSDVVTSLTLFQEEFLNSFRGYKDNQIVALGIEDTSAALAYKLPLSVGSSAWAAVLGGVLYDRVGEVMLPISFTPYAAAVAAEAKKLMSDQWTGWGDRPAELAFTARQVFAQLLAQQLQTGESTLSVENYLDTVVSPSTTVYIFAQAKAVNPLNLSDLSNTYTNLFTGNGNNGTHEFDAAPLNLASIDRVVNAASHQLGMNGKDFLNLEMAWALVPPQLGRQARRYFHDQGSRNDYVNEPSGTSTAEVEKVNTAKDLGVQVIEVPQLAIGPNADTTSWYPVFRTPTSRKAPWACITQIPAHMVPFMGVTPGLQIGNWTSDGIEWLIDDTTSEAYRHGNPQIGIPKGWVGIQGIRTLGAGIVNPRQIMKCKAA